MKILSAKQLRAWDVFTIENEPIASIDLMERASNAFANAFIRDVSSGTPVHVFCGPGNNGGDGLAIARLLLEQGYRVYPYFVRFSEKTAPDFQVNFDRLSALRPVKIIEQESAIPEMHQDDVIIDAIFGSGLSRPVTGLAATVIDAINNSRAHVVAVDIPSGLFCDTQSPHDTIIRAASTITFQTPKLSFLLPDTAAYAGVFRVVDIGLSPAYPDTVASSYYYTTGSLARSLVKSREKFSHKGTYGHALLVAGSYGKTGAAILATRACLRTGAGLVSAFIPKCGYNSMQTAVPEAMVITGEAEDEIAGSCVTEPFNVIGIGPGIGQSTATAASLEAFLQKGLPMVVDADALNLIARHPDLLKKLPKESVLTPHPKEFERLCGKWKNDPDKLEKGRKLAEKIQGYVVLKGAHTAVICPDGTCYFNATGNPGMATGGSGDVLTGMITGLLAQGYSSKEAALLGVYMHGYAGDRAAEHNSQQSMIASDIIDHIGDFYSGCH